MGNQQAVKNEWSHLRSEIASTFQHVTQGDLESFRGDLQALAEMIHEKSGEAREQVEAKLEKLMAASADMANRGAEAANEFAANVSERASVAYEQASETMQKSYEKVEGVVHDRPVESVAVAFGTGLIAGVIVGLVMRR